MEIDFARLRFAVPDDWRNESTLVFTMPPADVGGMMVAKKASTRPGASMSVTWQDAPASATPAAYLAEREQVFARQLPGYQVVARGPEGDGAFLEHRFDPGGMALLQLLLVRRIDDRFVVVTGTSLEAEHARVREKFLAAFRSLRAS